jgi:F420-dependent oxidoreductase-like protein
MMKSLGIPFDRPIRHLKEYLSVLVPLLNEGRVSFKGEMISCEAETFFKPDHPTTVVVAALGPQALGVAGRLADGTTLAWVGPRTVREHIKPRLSDAASAAGRPAPRIIATLPVCVTSNEKEIRSRISHTLKMYGELPSYKAMFEREGVDGPGQLALVGDESKVRDLMSELSESGVTDFAASEFTTNEEERTQTRDLLRKWTA